MENTKNIVISALVAGFIVGCGGSSSSDTNSTSDTNSSVSQDTNTTTSNQPSDGNGTAPDMNGTPPDMNGTGSNGSGSNATSTVSDSGYSQSSGTTTRSNETYSATNSDENAVKVTGGTFTMNSATITKTGDTTDTDGSSFYGINTAILATNGGTINMNGGTITTNAVGANAIVAYGGTVNVSDVTMQCTQNLSRGIHATGGGTITASDLNITTAGNNSSVIALDRGGGTVTVTGGTYKASGTDSAVLYSTGNLTVNNIVGTSSKGEIGVIEGDNHITINDSNITSGADSTSRGMMILQSGSGDSEGTNGAINVNGGNLVLTGDNTPFVEIVTNVTGTVTLNGAKTTIPSGILMKVDYNTRWDTNGATGILILSGSGTVYEGNIVADSYSTAQATVNQGVVWKGAYNLTNSAKSTSLVIDGGTWTLTGNSYVDSITLKNSAIINKSGYTLTAKSTTNTSGTIND